MKDKRDTDATEETLQHLFDQTAHEPTGPTMTKLAARARDVPGNARRRRTGSWWPGWAPVAVGAGAAAVVVLALRGAGEPVATPEPVAHMSVPVGPLPSVSGAPGPDEPSAQDETDLAVAELELSLTPEDPADGSDLDLMFGPETDDDLDAWLAATEELLGQDG